MIGEIHGSASLNERTRGIHTETQNPLCISLFKIDKGSFLVRVLGIYQQQSANTKMLRRRKLEAVSAPHVRQGHLSPSN